MKSLIILLAILPRIFVQAETDNAVGAVALNKLNCADGNCNELPTTISTTTEKPKPDPFVDGIFSVVAPGVIRRGKPFNVAVRGFRIRQTTKFSLKISGTTSTGQKLILKKFSKITLQNPKSVVQFSTFNIPNGTYEFCVTSDRGYVESKNLTYIPNEFTFLVQLDKSIYFPGDIIHFRVLSVDSETKAVNPKGRVDVTITDGSGSEVGAFKAVRFIKGKYQGELQVSSQPALGIWQVNVRSGSDSATKYLEVTNYEVPLIYASLIIQDKIPISFGRLPVVVMAKYSFNDEVDGRATVIFSRFGTDYFRTEIDIQSNVANFDVDLVADLKAAAGTFFNYEARLEFHDQFTNTTVTDFRQFEVVPASFEVILTCDNFLRPNKPFEFSVVLKKYDGSPADEGTTVQITIEPFSTSQTLHVDSNGFARSSVAVPGNATSISVGATAPGGGVSFCSAGLPFPELTNKTLPPDEDIFMIVEVITKNPRIYATVQVEVMTMELVDSLICLVSAKGILLETAEMTISDPNNLAARFTFNPTLSYAPLAVILCYYVKKNGFIVTTMASVDVNTQLNNFAKLTPGKGEYKPGETIEVQVDSKLLSTVSFGAVDQSIVNLQDGNNVVLSEIFPDMLKYYGWVNGCKRVPNYEYIFNLQGFLFFTNIPLENCRLSDPPTLEASVSRSNRWPVPVPSSHSGIKSPGKFADSILWKNVDIKTPLPGDATHKLGREKVTEVISTNLASYVLFGVSMNPFEGIGLTTDLSSFRVFRPFFITAEFPYSIKRTEILTQSITVYNFLSESQTFVISINKDPKYEISSASSFGWTDAGSSYERTVTTDVGVHSRLKIAIKGLQTGFINFRITAQGPLAGDSIDRVLKIEPFDVIKSITDSRLININANEVILSNVTCAYPSTLMEVLDVSASVSGDILGRPLTARLNNRELIHIPSGCGEQTLVDLVPDVVTYLYLSKSGQLTPDLSNSLIGYIRAGYQNELRWRGQDGGFSAWGDVNGVTPSSTWLTAYAGWSFYLSKNVITIDMSILRNTLLYLSTRQLADGSFIERSPLRYDQKMQGGSGNGIAMTAYVTNYIGTALPDFPEFRPMYQRAVAYLEANWWRLTDSYQLAIIGYALKLGNNPKAENILNILSTKRTETATMIWFPYIETTAYYLLALVERGGHEAEALKVATYLVSKSNQFGGYYYTQDTVIALYALSKTNLNFDGSIKLSLTPNIGSVINREITHNNSLVAEIIPLTISVNRLGIKANATNNGYAIVSLDCGFRAESLDFQPAFLISHQYSYTCLNRVVIQLFINFIPAGNQSGMTVAIVDLPSGFVYTNLITGPEVRLVQPQNNGETVTFYFDSIGNAPVGILFSTIRTKFVEGIKGGRVTVIDYYKPTNEAFLKFVLPDITNSCGIVFRK